MASLSEFQDLGYLVKRSVYSEQELLSIREALSQNSAAAGIWEKEVCATSRSYFNLATHPAIIRTVRELLGENVILWGGLYIERKPGQIHLWHTDIESSRIEGGFLSVWVGLEGVTRQSALKLVDHSHQFGRPLQQVIQNKGKTRESTTDENVCEWAAESHAGHPGITQPEITNGDAIFFDGRLWHGSDNRNPNEVRTALLFQFARADVAVRIPDYRNLNWPFTFREQVLPPCLAISGRADPELNKLAEPPPAIGGALPLLPQASHTIDLEAGLEDGKSFHPIPLFDGSTPNLAKLSAHYSVLAPGAQPHPVHCHIDEEVLIVLKGQAELRYEEDGLIVDHRVEAGEGVYYPAFHQHTIHNPGREPIIYMMLKWVGGGPVDAGQRDPLDVHRFKVEPFMSACGVQPAFQCHRCFFGPTRHLKGLELHISTLCADGGYAAHCDEHDVALLVLEGSVQVNGRKIGSGQLHWIPAGSSHDMTNPDGQPARYLAVEFHGGNCAGDSLQFSKRKVGWSRRLFKKRSAKRVMRNLKRLIGIRI